MSCVVLSIIYSRSRLQVKVKRPIRACPEEKVATVSRIVMKLGIHTNCDETQCYAFHLRSYNEDLGHMSIRACPQDNYITALWNFLAYALCCDQTQCHALHWRDVLCKPQQTDLTRV